MSIKKSVLETIGKTPLIEIERYKAAKKINNNLFAKVEFFNPGGSVKDRVGLKLIKQAYQDGLINEKTTIIEPTSGNTGIGLAIACAIYGNELILTMPETMSIERQKLLKAYGAKIVLTSAKKGMQGSVDKANELADKIENSYIPGQFVNPNNPLAHQESTALEIIEDFNDDIDYFVAGIGTGGTITGIARVLKEKYPDIKIVGIEPEDSPLISKGKAGPHDLQGIGANFIPDILDLDLIDSIITVSSEDAYQASRLLAKKEGLLVGITAGAALHGASKLPGEDKNIVVLLPDTGERYLSTELFK
ncbi:cysteine synthase A [Erysipelatoclostridium sp. An173]|uniref:cysteine synthase A n=1 Tax=unclassified Thomasclavelia TaxID=3025756 RepID=UPI000B378E63|nr:MULTISPECIES: cysteine synthase A [unclassified Thomasclavelia]OUP76979.1 cysteine synthase A [Erysipelatoclostridium sp. An173]